MPNSQQTASISPDGANTANIIPAIARSLLGLMEERGHSPERVCQGLGFRYEDLLSHQLLLSHRQMRTEVS